MGGSKEACPPGWGRGPSPDLLGASTTPILTLCWLGLHLETCAPQDGDQLPPLAIYTGVWCFSPQCFSYDQLFPTFLFLFLTELNPEGEAEARAFP